MLAPLGLPCSLELACPHHQWFVPCRRLLVEFLNMPVHSYPTGAVPQCACACLSSQWVVLQCLTLQPLFDFCSVCFAAIVFYGGRCLAAIGLSDGCFAAIVTSLLSGRCFATKSVMWAPSLLPRRMLGRRWIPWRMLCHHCLFGSLFGRCFATESVLVHYLADTWPSWSLGLL